MPKWNHVVSAAPRFSHRVGWWKKLLEDCWRMTLFRGQVTSCKVSFGCILPSEHPILGN